MKNDEIFGLGEFMKYVVIFLILAISVVAFFILHESEKIEKERFIEDFQKHCSSGDLTPIFPGKMDFHIFLIIAYDDLYKGLTADEQKKCRTYISEVTRIMFGVNETINFNKKTQIIQFTSKDNIVEVTYCVSPDKKISTDSYMLEYGPNGYSVIDMKAGSDGIWFSAILRTRAEAAKKKCADEKKDYSLYQQLETSYKVYEMLEKSKKHANK